MKGVTLSYKNQNSFAVNELQIDKVYGDYFVKGDAVQLIDWRSFKGANPIRVKDVEGQSHLQENEEVFNLQFVDGTEINLSHIQLFSILNDPSLRYQIKTEAWTLNEINKDTWKGTIATEPVVKVY